MHQIDFADLFAPNRWFTDGRGPRYKQLHRHLKEAIANDLLEEGALLPPEREMAVLADVSRATIRKAIGGLADERLLDQRHGSGSYVREKSEQRLKASLSSLVSFTETMALRGYESYSKILGTGLFTPTPGETASLGLTGAGSVARIKRLRLADPGPLAIETSSIPADILPDPSKVGQSLYAVLRLTNNAPTRAIQRISAINLSSQEAELLGAEKGAAFLKVDRTGYLPSGRPVEFTTGVYRSDIYDFIAEVRLEGA